MCGQYQYFGYLHMFWRIGGIDSHIGNVVACQGGDAFVQFGSTLFVTLEADIAEVRFQASGLSHGWRYQPRRCADHPSTPLQLPS